MKGGRHNKVDFELTKQQTMGIAKELKYGNDVLTKLRNAETEYELTRIMCQARKSSR